MRAKMRVGILAACGAIFAVATAVSAYLGYLWMFVGFTNYDDEGFMLIALRSFVSGHALYDKVVVQYGPFFFEVFGMLGALGVSFDNDSGRLVTLVVWVAIALLTGVAVFAYTRNLALSLSAQLISFATGSSFTGEPMHPGALVSLLIIGIAAVAMITAGRTNPPPSEPGARRAHFRGGGQGEGGSSFLLIGALTAAAILTKVNVGGFAAISIAFACVITFPTLARIWPARLVVAAAFVVVPFLLMRTALDQGWAQRYAFHIGICALALVVATTTSRADPERRLAQLARLLAGGGVVTVVVLAVALLTGSSLNDLVNGVVLYPLNQRQAFEAPLPVPTSVLAWDLVGLGGAVLWTVYRLFARRPEMALEGGIRVLAGLVIWVFVLGSLHIPGLFHVKVLDTHPLTVPLALAWVVAAPRGRPDGFDGPDFARALVPALAILQALHAFPVAGSQVLWAALTLVPLGAISIADGLAQLGLARVRLQLAAALVFLTIVVSWLPPTWRERRSTYNSSVAVDVPGATRIRVPADQAALLRQVTQSIRDNCDTFISLPGLDSFYIFAQLEPPTPLPTRYMWLIDDFPHERALVEASKRINRLCVVENDFLIASWSHGRHMDGPLATYIQEGFMPAYTFEHYSILIRR